MPKGITTKKMKDGSTAIMVRFKYLGKTYPIKNFTKLYGITTQTKAEEKLFEIKKLISEGKNPFAKQVNTLNDLFDERKKTLSENGTWSKATETDYVYFYKRTMRENIGELKPNKIKYEDIMKIIDSFRPTQTAQKNKVLSILNPIFREEMRKKNIFENPCEHIEKFKEVPREDISLRVLNKKPIEIIREIYHAIDRFDYSKHSRLEMNKMYWKMCLLTAHRMGEVLQLEKKHCYIEENKIISPASITKTKEDYHFPIPEECLDYVKSVENGKLFKMSSSGSLYYDFQRILKKTNIKLVENKTLSIHDVRKLMLSIMTKDLKIDSRLADYCLDHTQKGTIKHYLEFTYEDKVEAYNKYWSYIRGEGEEVQKEQVSSNNNSNFDKLIELRNMLNDGLITKEIFEYERDRLY